MPLAWWLRRAVLTLLLGITAYASSESTLANPTEVASFDPVYGYAYEVAVAGDYADNYAYIADGESGLCISAVTNPYAPI